MHVLAIVIPAYKPDFFRAALQSVVAQTDKRFRVYVGDDAGPPEIGRIAAELSGSGVDIVYRRFDENLGASSLSAHWNRCVALANEPWVWLFSDDDIMAPDCVAAVYAELEEERDDAVLRFDTEVIDREGRTLSRNAAHPSTESGVDFIYARLRGERNSYVVEYVFRRDAFDRAGGFPDYPVAWCADDVAWFSFSQGGVIRTLGRGLVRWRASGVNITDAKRRNQSEKLQAGALFLRFVREQVQPRDRGGRTPEQWRDAAERWWIGQVRYLMPIGPAVLPLVLRSAEGVWRRGRVSQVATLAWWNMVGALRALRGVARRVVARRRWSSAALPSVAAFFFLPIGIRLSADAVAGRKGTQLRTASRAASSVTSTWRPTNRCAMNIVGSAITPSGRSCSGERTATKRCSAPSTGFSSWDSPRKTCPSAVR